MIKMIRISSTGKVDEYEIWQGSRVVRITHDKELGTVYATTWVDNGNIICPKNFSGKTLVGAKKFAQNWLNR